MNRKFFSTSAVVLVVTLFAFLSSLSFGQPQEVDKQKIVSRVAQDWIRIGTKQYEKGFYGQAEKSLLRALDYQKYLSVSDINQINDLLTKVKSASESDSVIAENMQKGGELFAEGKLLEAQACYEQAKNSPGISKDKLDYIEGILKEIDEKIKQRTKAVDQICKDSVKLFEKEDYENARKGFLEVSRESLFKAEKGKSAEEYLAKIDSILVQRTEFPSLETEEAERAQAEESLLTEIAAPVSDDGEAAELMDVNAVTDVAATKKPTVDVAEAKAIEKAPKPTLSVKESYSRAVVKSAVDNADKLTREGRFYHANKAVEKAYNVLEANRSVIGVELYNQHKNELKVLSDMIIAGRTDWLGETEDKAEEKKQ